LPLVPAKLLKGSDRTWVIFTTRFCAQCGPVERLLRVSEPESRVVTVDAEREPHLAKAFRVATAPTVLLADRNGNVLQRFVGAAAVTNFVR
jgi:glutaredoxin